MILTYKHNHLIEHLYTPINDNYEYEKGFMMDKDVRKSISFINYKNSTYRYKI